VSFGRVTPNFRVQALTLSLHVCALNVAVHNRGAKHVQFVVQGDELIHKFVFDAAVGQLFLGGRKTTLAMTASSGYILHGSSALGKSSRSSSGVRSGQYLIVSTCDRNNETTRYARKETGARQSRMELVKPPCNT
jgi:hypothetical protein